MWLSGKYLPSMYEAVDLISTEKQLEGKNDVI